MFPEQIKEQFIKWGWTLSYDLVGEVFYRSDHDGTQWVVVCPDGDTFTMVGDNPEGMLGTY
jgi:hypothetical protein